MILTTGAMLGYAPFFVQEKEEIRNFEVAHVAFNEVYTSNMFRKYPEKSSYSALQKERDAYLEKATALPYKEILTEETESSTATKIIIKKIRPVNVNTYVSGLTFVHTFFTSDQTSYNKVMEMELEYMEENNAFFVISRRVVFSEESQLAAETKKHLLQQKEKEKNIEGTPLEITKVEKTKEQLKIFFDTLNLDKVKAESLTRDLQLENYYHGKFNIETLTLGSVVEDEAGTKKMYSNIRYESTAFEETKVFYIEMKDNTIIQIEERRNN
ncbi:MAG: hypothetical protein ACRC6X_06580 [Culicoidibacterales bacterium]